LNSFEFGKEKLLLPLLFDFGAMEIDLGKIGSKSKSSSLLLQPSDNLISTD
jgi:hypothetical protein